MATEPAMAVSKRKLKHLVVDSGALIKGSGYRIANMAENFVTVAEVLAEVRDPKARFHLETLPFELSVREPSEEAMKAVVAFSQKTGDFPALSKVDMKVLALAYTTHAEEVGTESIRKDVVGVIRPSQQSAARPPVALSDALAAQTKAGQDIGNTETLSESTVGESGVSTVGQSVGFLASAEGEELTDSSSAFEGDEEFPVSVMDEAEMGEIEGKWEDADEGEEEDLIIEGDIDSGENADCEGETGPEEEEEEEVGNDSQKQGLAAGVPRMEEEKKCSWADAVRSRKTGSRVAVVQNRAPVKAPARRALETELEELKLGGPEATEDKSNPVMPKQGGSAVPYTSKLLGSYSGSSRVAVKDSEDDGKGWVSLNNLEEVKTKGNAFGNNWGNAVTDISEDAVVACITTDFSMQNVLMQMGLRVASLDGMLIQRIKQWARRCDSCEKIIHDHSRLFCPRCGLPHMSRVSISVDHKTGATKVFLSKHRKPNTRGCKYPLPRPGKAPRFEGELLLKEDQLLYGIWKQKLQRSKRQMASMFGEEITDSLGMDVQKSVGIQVGYGKKNPNAQKGRERRGKKKRGSKP